MRFSLSHLETEPFFDALVDPVPNLHPETSVLMISDSAAGLVFIELQQNSCVSLVNIGGPFCFLMLFYRRRRRGPSVGEAAATKTDHQC